MIELTLCIFKPDLAARHVDAMHAFVRLISIDLVPVALRRGRMTIAQASALYFEHVGEPHFKRNVEFMTSGESVVMVLEGERACSRLRELIGSTDPQKAQPGTLRAMYGTELPRNAAHGSASPAAAACEIPIFFPVLGDW